jgi:hypothetical protein
VIWCNVRLKGILLDTAVRVAALYGGKYFKDAIDHHVFRFPNEGSAKIFKQVNREFIDVEILPCGQQ